MRSQVTALFGHTDLRVRPLAGPRTGFIRCTFQLWILAFAVMTLMVAALPTLPARAEAPKLGDDLCDRGRCTTELRRPSRGNIRDRLFRRTLLQRPDPRRPQQPLLQ